MTTETPIFDFWRNAYARLVAASTLVLVFAGGLVTSTGSSLSVPDWPLSYGQLMPPMVGGVFYEHGHRMIAGTVGILVLLMFAWFRFAEPRRSVRNLAAAALGAVFLQALLGGLTVLFLLPTPVSVGHACLGQIFCSITIAIAVVTGRSWIEAPARVAAPADAALRTASTLLVASVFVQLLLGAVMRHKGAGLTIPDFPLAFGHVVPPLDSFPVVIHFAHRVWACVVIALVGVNLGLATRGGETWLVRPVFLLIGLVSVQVTLGALTIWTSKAVVPTTAHVATGAAILATSLVLAMRARRLPLVAPSASAARARAEATA